MLTTVSRLLSSKLKPLVKIAMAPKSDMAAFKQELAAAKHTLILTGAGISAESGIPTFRGAGGLWRKYEATSLATPEAFHRDPSLVWEFYQYRRHLVLTKEPNAAHFAVAEFEKKAVERGKQVSVVTQNIDELHRKAGTQNLLELHGRLFWVRCIDCGHVESNYDDPICPALEGKGAPEPKTKPARIPRDDLPKCSQCKTGLIRPGVIWFGENLDPEVLAKADQIMDDCDLCLVVGTSSVVYPAAMFAPALAARGVTVAEFNVEETPATDKFGYHFHGPACEKLVEALKDY